MYDTRRFAVSSSSGDKGVAHAIFNVITYRCFLVQFVTY